MFKSTMFRRLGLNAVYALTLMAVLVTAGVGLYRMTGLKGTSAGVTRDVAKVVNESAHELTFIRDKGWDQVENSFGLQAAIGAIWVASLMLGSALAGSTKVRWRNRMAELKLPVTPASVTSTDGSRMDGAIYGADGEQAAGATHAVVGGRRGRISPAELLSHRHRYDHLICVSTTINRDTEDVFEIPAA